MWNKHSCFETSMHAPLIVAPAGGHLPAADPAQAGSQPFQPGSRVRSLVEFIDIYPSLCELAGLDIPPHVQGSSFVNLLVNPAATGKPFAIGRFGNGDTIRSDDFRFSEYADKQGSITGQMLYNQELDPGENTNIAAESREKAAELAEELRQRKGK